MLPVLVPRYFAYFWYFSLSLYFFRYRPLFRSFLRDFLILFFLLFSGIELCTYTEYNIFRVLFILFSGVVFLLLRFLFLLLFHSVKISLSPFFLSRRVTACLCFVFIILFPG